MFLTYRNDFRGAATLALGPARAREAHWTSGAIPTLDNALLLLADLLRPVCPHWSLALQDGTVVSPLDAAEGHYEPVITAISRTTPTTVLAMSQAFATVIAPLTRIKAARYWRSCLTWALARRALAQLLPMPPDVPQCSWLCSGTSLPWAPPSPLSRPLWMPLLPATARAASRPL
jgi:hypothetical protein